MRLSVCQGLKGHDLAPARSVKLFRRDGQLIGCVLPRGPVRQIATSEDIQDKSYNSFKLRSVVGGFVLFDESFNNPYVHGGRTVVYHVRTGHRYSIATNFGGPSEHFEAPVAFIDARGRSVAAIVSTTPDEPHVTIARLRATGAQQTLDEGSPEEIPTRFLTRTGDAVSWLHSGVVQTAPFA
jgi:hypothetical protein